MTETWTTGVLAITTPRGTRYVGVTYVGEGRPHTIRRMPKAELVRFTTRPRVNEYDASDQARSRTIHHNLWHDAGDWSRTPEAQAMHARGARLGDCKEGPRVAYVLDAEGRTRVVIDGETFAPGYDARTARYEISLRSNR